MSKNKYLEAAGVVRLRWRRGLPETGHGPVVIVEVWDASLYQGSTVPSLAIHAKTEIWVRQANKWFVLHWSGALNEAKPYGPAREVRRWAPMTTRTWRGNATLDGWNTESE